MENRHTKEELRYMQSLPLDLKIRLTEDRIRAWVDKYGENGVCVSFSGGKDSTVLLHIVRSLYPEVRAVFSNTGLEYPEIRQFAMAHDNVDIVYPDVRFKDVITQYGYPLIGKEVAEAIYYARRIGGGCKELNNKRTELHGRRRKNLSAQEQVYRNKHRSEHANSSIREISTTERGGGYTRSRKEQSFVVQISEGRTKTARTPGVQNRGSDTDGEYF